MKKANYILIVAVLIIALIVIVVVQKNRSEEVLPVEEVSDSFGQETVIEGIEAVFEDGSVGEVSLEKLNPPKLKSKVSSNATPEMKERIEALQNVVEADPGSFTAWLELGLLYKGVDDFEQARVSWEFASLLRPESSMPNSNLANLYGWYLGDIEKAEENFRLAIDKQPSSVTIYGQAYEFYRDVVKNPEKGIEIVKEGYAATHDDLLKAFLEEQGEL